MDEKIEKTEKKKKTRPWFIRLGFVDDAFIARVKAEADRKEMHVSEYVTELLEREVGKVETHGRKCFR